jgi:hypothetical protein
MTDDFDAQLREVCAMLSGATLAHDGGYLPQPEYVRRCKELARMVRAVHAREKVALEELRAELVKRKQNQPNQTEGK